MKRFERALYELQVDLNHLRMAIEAGTEEETRRGAELMMHHLRTEVRDFCEIHGFGRSSGDGGPGLPEPTPR